MKHATHRALFVVWAGCGDALRADIPEEVPFLKQACDSETVSFEPSGQFVSDSSILVEIPTCPRCAVLYDEAMQAREELLGRAAA